jgi:hypothetical protein
MDFFLIDFPDAGIRALIDDDHPIGNAVFWNGAIFNNVHGGIF